VSCELQNIHQREIFLKEKPKTTSLTALNIRLKKKTVYYALKGKDVLIQRV